MSLHPVSRPARPLLLLLGGVWPLLAFGSVLAVTRLMPPAWQISAPVVCDPLLSGARDAAPPIDPRQDPTLALQTPSPALDSLFRPLAAFQYRRYQDAAQAQATDEEDRAYWHHLQAVSLYDYRILRMELTPAAIRAAHLPDL